MPKTSLDSLKVKMISSKERMMNQQRKKISQSKLMISIKEEKKPKKKTRNQMTKGINNQRLKKSL